MERSLAALLGRPLGASARSRPSGRGGRGGRAHGRARGRLASSAEHRLAGAPLRAGRDLFTALSARRRLRIALICAVLALAVLAGGWAWLRHSPLAAVRHVRLSGARGPEAHQIDAALLAAARRQSTLDVNTAALRAAVAPFPVVREVRASASFPHTLRVTVVEQLPVAVLTYGSARTAVTADGAVLGPALISRSLPELGVWRALSQGQRVHDAGALEALATLGAAPSLLLRDVQRAYTGPKGLTLAMHSGLLVYFGDATRAHAKWVALVRVLADPGSAGASYVDVRLPERPAAGFPPGVTRPAAGSAPEAEGEGAGDPSAAAAEAGADGQAGTIQALAAALEKAAGIENGAGATGKSSEEEGETEAGPNAEGGGASGTEGAGGERSEGARGESSAPAREGSAPPESSGTPSGEAAAGGATGGAEPGSGG